MGSESDLRIVNGLIDRNRHVQNLEDVGLIEKFDRRYASLGWVFSQVKKFVSSSFSLNFQPFSFFISWWKYSPSCSIIHSGLLIHVSKTVMGASYLVGWSSFLSSAGQGCCIQWAFAWYNQRGISYLVRNPGCKPGAVSAGSFVREDIQCVVLHNADMHCPGGCLNLWVIFFGNRK
jgi:hypothetical protein